MRRLFISLILCLAPVASGFGQLGDSTLVAGSSVSGRSPVVAVGLSMLMPGAGQLYLGEQGKAAMHFGLFAAAVTWVALRDIGPTNADIRPVDWLGVICVGGTYLWAAIDAGLNAGNQDGSSTGGTSPGVSEGRGRHLSVSPFACRRAAGLSLAYQF
jgi:TM2 domain-containing membrane protein YozV